MPTAISRHHLGTVIVKIWCQSIKLMSRYYVEYIKEYIKTSLLLHWAPGFPSSTLAANPIQFVQIATAQLVFTFPKLSHFTAFWPALQWLPVGAPSHFKTPVLPYKTARGAVTQNHQIRIQTCTPTQSLTQTHVTFHPSLCLVPSSHSTQNWPLTSKLFIV